MLEFLGLEEHPHYSEEELKVRLELITQEMEGGQS